MSCTSTLQEHSIHTDQLIVGFEYSQQSFPSNKPKSGQPIALKSGSAMKREPKETTRNLPKVMREPISDVKYELNNCYG